MGLNVQNVRNVTHIHYFIYVDPLKYLHVKGISFVPQIFTK